MESVPWTCLLRYGSGIARPGATVAGWEPVHACLAERFWKCARTAVAVREPLLGIPRACESKVPAHTRRHTERDEEKAHVHLSLCLCVCAGRERGSWSRWWCFESEKGASDVAWSCTRSDARMERMDDVGRMQRRFWSLPAGSRSRTSRRKTRDGIRRTNQRRRSCRRGLRLATWGPRAKAGLLRRRRIRRHERTKEDLRHEMCRLAERKGQEGRSRTRKWRCRGRWGRKVRRLCHLRCGTRRRKSNQNSGRFAGRAAVKKRIGSRPSERPTSAILVQRTSKAENRTQSTEARAIVFRWDAQRTVRT